jgi:ribosomal protein S18 acetylase RimI-like enzyme
MDDIPSIEVRPLTEERLGDYLRFFDEKAFTDNPRWAFCYCYFPYHDPDKIDWQRRTGPRTGRRSARVSATGPRRAISPTQGTRSSAGATRRRAGSIRCFNDEPAPDAETTGSIFCFIVAPAYRKKGISRSLLAAACDGLRERGHARRRGEAGQGRARRGGESPWPLSLVPLGRLLDRSRGRRRERVWCEES